jgi:ABC-2 type transport system permease protein
VRDGHEEQDRFLRSLRQRRAAAFRKEIVPYFRYVAQSGFGLLMSAVVFTLLIWYVDLIKDVPPDWPADIAGIVIVSAAAVYAPLRTYLRPADPVYLLPLENRLMHAYLGQALSSSIINAVLRTLAAFAIFAPVYMRAPVTQKAAQAHPIVLLALLFALLGAFNAYAGWRERRPASRLWRISFKAVRWGLTIIIAAALLLKPLALAVPFMLLCAAFLWIMWRVPRQHFVPWEKLINDEEATRRRWMSFLSWFVDVPTETAKPARRRWLAWIGDMVPWRQRRAWDYLYAKTFLRSETLGAFGRWITLIGIVMIVVDSVLADLIAYGVGFAIAALQLSELRRVRFVETVQTLPIPPEGRYTAAAYVARAAGITAVVLLWLAGVLSLRLFQPELWLPALAAGLLWCGWIVPRRIGKHPDDEEDE